jgi:hypothetical protein
MRTKFRLLPAKPGQDPAFRDYQVLTQEEKGQRWTERGMVSRYGVTSQPGARPSWSALGKDADAWTNYFGTRAEATQEMLGGHTWKTRQAEADRAAWEARCAGEPVQDLLPEPDPEPELEAG